MLFLDKHSPEDDSVNGSWVHLTVNCMKLGAGGGGVGKPHDEDLWGGVVLGPHRR